VIITTPYHALSQYSSGIELNHDEHFLPHVPLSETEFLNKFGTTIITPKKIYRTLYNHAPMTILMKAGTKPQAIDKAMIFASMITQYREFDRELEIDTLESTERPYTYIHSSKLKEVFGDGAKGYKRVVDILLKGTKKNGPIIECDNVYRKSDENGDNGKALGYRFSAAYYGKGWNNYPLKTDKGKESYLNLHYKAISKVITHPIVQRIVYTYSYLKLPSKKELLEWAKANEGTVLKNGKILKFKNKHKTSYFKSGKYSLVEDNIKKFELLTKGGNIIPIIGDHRSGGRIVDSYTLMPSWIRGLIKIDNKPLQEYDYSSLHPNICLSLYGSEQEKTLLGGDVHTNVSNITGISRNIIKKEHLSFFNKRIESMKIMELWNYYWEVAPIMMSNIVADKESHGHYVTSRKLFKIEVDMMKEVMTRLNENDLCIYVYDALYGNDDKKIITIMNEVAQDFGVQSRVS